MNKNICEICGKSIYASDHPQAKVYHFACLYDLVQKQGVNEAYINMKVAHKAAGGDDEQIT